MRITLPSTGQTVNVRFNHERHDRESYVTDSGKKKSKQKTFSEAKIFFHEGTAQEIVVWGRSYLNLEDQFCAETGRRISLNRALEISRSYHYISSKEEREIWVGYFSR